MALVDSNGVRPKKAAMRTSERPRMANGFHDLDGLMRACAESSVINCSAVRFFSLTYCSERCQSALEALDRAYRADRFHTLDRFGQVGKVGVRFRRAFFQLVEQHNVARNALNGHDQQRRQIVQTAADLQFLPRARTVDLHKQMKRARSEIPGERQRIFCFAEAPGDV